MSTMLR